MSLDPKIAEFAKKHGVSQDELWVVRPGTYAIKHKALERIAKANGIKFSRPAVLQNDEAGVALLADGSMGDKSDWTTGEASAKNCKNQYYWAMAEKRLKDRLILKLLDAHADIYSEDEADDFGDAGERSPPGQDAVEKGYHYVITLYCKDRKGAEDFYKQNKGMINQFRKNFKDRVLEQLKIISEKGEAA